tara:strand:- start:3410 stop:3880 length:471 start_codon:yes stop_codon:yes gene_type:complete
MNIVFRKRVSITEVEEGNNFQPKFDESGLIPVITTDYKDKIVLMHGYMNEEALKKSLDTGFVHYWSRSRKTLWEKGQTSGLKQKIKEIKIDDDQDCMWFSVEVFGNGASCHVGYRSCFYRKIKLDIEMKNKLEFTEKNKVFDPQKVYGDAPNPTKL